MISALLESKKKLRSVLSEVTCSNSIIFPEDIANKIILHSLTPSEIKDVISDEFVRSIRNSKHDTPWDMDSLTGNRMITLKTILKNNDLPWDWESVIHREDLPKGFLEQLFAKRNSANFWNVMTDPCNCYYVPIYLIEKYWNKRWNWSSLSNRVTLKFVERHMTDISWNWKGIMANKNIPIDFIDRHMYHPTTGVEIPWNWRHLSKLSKLTPKFIRKHITDVPWAWECLSANPKLTMDIVADNLNMPWDWQKLSGHPNLTLDFVDEHTSYEVDGTVVEIPWDYHTLSYHKGLTMEFVGRHINNHWHWHHLSYHERLTAEFVMTHTHYTVNGTLDEIPWEWDGISSNILRFENAHAKEVIAEFFSQDSTSASASASASMTL